MQVRRARGLFHQNLGLGEKFSGRLIRTIVMSTSGNYTPDPEAKKVRCQLVGAGASGSSPATTDAASYTAAGGGGGGGGFVEFEIDLIVTKITNLPVTIGLGGASVTGSVGIIGGTTWFGTKIYASGGSSGSISTRPQVNYTNAVNSLMVIPGVPGIGEFKETELGYKLLRKSNGTYGGWGYLGTQGQLGGSGGASMLSGEVFAAGNGGFGNNGADAGYGAGGSGTCNLYNDPYPEVLTYSAKPSGAGANGVAIFYEYS